MKHGILILTLACVAGLLISSLGLANEPAKMMEGAQKDTSHTGMQTMTQTEDMQQLQTLRQPETLDLNPSQIAEMQQLLNQEGYDLSSVKGILDQETMAAIRLFQESERLTVTGMPNPETLRALAPSGNMQEFFGLAPEFKEYTE